jgi:hypothetical protein
MELDAKPNKLRPLRRRLLLRVLGALMAGGMIFSHIACSSAAHQDVSPPPATTDRSPSQAAPSTGPDSDFGPNRTPADDRLGPPRM